MINPFMLMAMQTAHPADMMSAGHSTKQPDVDAMIAAGMAAGMPRVQWCAVRWVGANDGGMLEELREALLSEAMNIQAIEDWKDPDNTIVESFVDMALAEAGSFSNLTTIEGFGAIKTPSDRYRWMGWHKPRWYRWRTKYEAVYLVLFNWTMDGYRHLIRAQID
jgi:hypothetical protein